MLLVEILDSLTDWLLLTELLLLELLALELLAELLSSSSCRPIA